MTSPRTRRRLVDELRAGGIRDQRVLDAIFTTPRHWFIEEALESRAYDNKALPIGLGQTISQPFIVALMTQTLLAHAPCERVLEIGTGSGYQTAILAALVTQVYSVERIPRLQDQARERLRRLGLFNVRLKFDDGYQGWSRYAPFDAIMVTAACDAIPEPLLAQLAPHGRLVGPVGGGGSQELLLVARKGAGFDTQSLGPVSFVPLRRGLG